MDCPARCGCPPPTSPAVDFVLAPPCPPAPLKHPDIRQAFDSAPVDLPARPDIAILVRKNPDLDPEDASWALWACLPADHLRRTGVPVPGERFATTCGCI